MPMRTLAGMSATVEKRAPRGRPFLVGGRDGYFFLTVRLLAVNPFVVGFTHLYGKVDRASHSGGADVDAATAVTWKKVPRRARKLKAPLAVTFAVPSFRRSERFAPPKTDTAAAPRP